MMADVRLTFGSGGHLSRSISPAQLAECAWALCWPCSDLTQATTSGGQGKSGRLQTQPWGGIEESTIALPTHTQPPSESPSTRFSLEEPGPGCTLVH